jgi:hypothetical protein
MHRSTLIVKRFLHDRKLPIIEGYTVKDIFVKGSQISPKKADNNINNKIIKVKVKKGRECWSNLKKHGWFTN